jgi:hypothetical protein
MLEDCLRRLSPPRGAGWEPRDFVQSLEIRRVSRAAAWCPVAPDVAITSYINLMVRPLHARTMEREGLLALTSRQLAWADHVLAMVMRVATYNIYNCFEQEVMTTSTFDSFR